jgi:hypothetical protein
VGLSGGKDWAMALLMEQSLWCGSFSRAVALMLARFHITSHTMGQLIRVLASGRGMRQLGSLVAWCNSFSEKRRAEESSDRSKSRSRKKYHQRFTLPS